MKCGFAAKDIAGDARELEAPGRFRQILVGNGA
jgi:hypothetical protein